MYEHLSDMFGGLPNKNHFRLYSQWSKHSWGVVITGNVQVSSSHLSLGRDMVVPTTLSDKDIQPFKQLVASIRGQKGSETLAIMQLCHAGRQSSNIIGGRLPFAPPLAPSAIRVGSNSSTGFASKLFNQLMFQTPRAMSLDDIDMAVDQFVQGAVLAVMSGFDGVELHAAHGCQWFWRTLRSRGD